MSLTPKSAYRQFRQSMLEHNEEWKSLLADDVQLTGPLAAVKGKEAFIAVNGPFFAAIKDSRLLDLVTLADQVVTRIETDVASPDGQILTLSVSEWYRFRDGRLQTLTVYFDPRPLLPPA